MQCMFIGTALLKAASRGWTGVVGRLVGGGASLHHTDQHGWTALIEAVVNKVQ